MGECLMAQLSIRINTSVTQSNASGRLTLRKGGLLKSLLRSGLHPLVDQQRALAALSSTTTITSAPCSTCNAETATSMVFKCRES